MNQNSSIRSVRFFIAFQHNYHLQHGSKQKIQLSKGLAYITDIRKIIGSSTRHFFFPKESTWLWINITVMVSSLYESCTYICFMGHACGALPKLCRMLEKRIICTWNYITWKDVIWAHARQLSAGLLFVAYYTQSWMLSLSEGDR